MSNNERVEMLIRLKVRSFNMHDAYHELFLEEVAVRKHKHKSRKIDKIVSDVMADMPVLYDKNVMQISTDKCLDRLQSAIDNCDGIPENWKGGQTISHVVKKILKELDI